MTTIYLMLLTLFLVMGIKLCKIKINNRFQNVLSPRLILVISYYMYSAAMPISRLFFDSIEISYDTEYMEAQILGALGILTGLYFSKYYHRIGLYFSKYYHRFKKNKGPAQVAQIYVAMLAIVIITIAVGIFMFVSLQGLGWDLSAIFSPRNYESYLQTGNQEITLFGQILWVLAISSTVLAFIGAYNRKSNKLILFVLLVAGLFSIFFLFRGARLYVGLMILPLICVCFYSKPIKIKYVLLSCLCIYFVVYMVGLVRDVGFAQMAGVSIRIEDFDPLTQEFGTNYSVFKKWKAMKAMGRDDSMLFGKSYTIDVLYNMVPSYFWPDRPYTAAVQFSLDYFNLGKINELTSAFGFSPIVEALINFGFIGIVPVFAFVSFLVFLLESWFMRKREWGIACYAFMIPIVINWNRMDMAITLKILIIYLVVSKIFAALMYRRRIARC